MMKSLALFLFIVAPATALSSGGSQYIHRETSDRQELLHWCFKESSVDALCRSGIVQAANKDADFHVLEIGCGAGHTTLGVLSETLPSTTKITAVDADQGMIEAAKRKQHDNNRIAFLHTTGEELAETMPATFDAVWIRFVVVHVPDPMALLEASVKCLKPGGILLVEDTCVASGSPSSSCEPPSYAHAFFHVKHAQATLKLSGDLTRGAKTGGYMNDIGLKKIHCNSFAPVFGKDVVVAPWAGIDSASDNPPSEQKYKWGLQLFQQSFDSLLPKVQELGLCTDKEASRAQASLQDFVPSLFCVPDGTVFQWWGVKE